MPYQFSLKSIRETFSSVQTQTPCVVSNLDLLPENVSSQRKLLLSFIHAECRIACVLKSLKVESNFWEIYLMLSRCLGCGCEEL